MAWIGICIQMIPVVIKLITLAEQAFDGIADSGEEKKEMVTTAVREIIKGLSGFTLDDATWAKIDGVVGPLIDLACSVIFPHKEESK